LGDRGQVKVIQWGDKPVYLYTHWGASELVETVKSVLRRKLRWDDDAYLTRMIFSKMIEDDIDGELGYGISAGPCDHYISVNLHVKNQEVEIVNHGDTLFQGSFTDFINS